MHQALRPYVTTGVALVGASAIAVAPVIPTPAPPDIQIANPAPLVERGVQLTALEIEEAVNALVYNFIARPTVAGAQLIGKLVAPLVGEEQAFLLPLAALGLAGPLISGGGAIGTALQDIVDSHGLEEILVNLIGAPGTIIDGFVNGGYGPDLAPLVQDILIAVNPALGALVPLGLFPTILAGGLINLQNVVTTTIPTPVGPITIPAEITLPGTIPTLQGLIEQVFGLLGHEQTQTVTTLAAVQPADDTKIEDGVNAAVYAATAATIRLVTLAAPLVAPILGVSKEEAAGFLALGTIGLAGPLISGTGGVGTAIQNLVNSHSFEEFAVNTLGLVSTPIDAVVNGGYGPNLVGLVGDALPPLPPVQVNPNPPPPVYVQPEYTDVRAGGLISGPKSTVTVVPNPPSLPSINVGVQLPGTIPTVQSLVERVFDSLPSGHSTTNLKVAGTAESNAVAPADDPAALPKKGPLLNVLKINPLTPPKKDGAANPLGGGKHSLGIGKTPVRDLVNKVLGGHKKDSGGGDDGPSNPS